MSHEPSTPAKGGTRDFWKKHSVSPDTTKLKQRIKDEDEKRRDMFKNEKSPNLDRDKEFGKSLERSTAMKDTLRKARKK